MLYAPLKNRMKRVTFSLSLLAFSFPTSIVAGKIEGFRIHFRCFLFSTNTPAYEIFVFNNVYINVQLFPNLLSSIF